MIDMWKLIKCGIISFQLILVGIVFSFSTPVFSKEISQKNVVYSIEIAEKISLKAFKRYTNNKIKRFSCRLIDENENEWVFSYDDLDKMPRPGSDVFVVVNKKSGRTATYYGK